MLIFFFFFFFLIANVHVQLRDHDFSSSVTRDLLCCFFLLSTIYCFVLKFHTFKSSKVTFSTYFLSLYEHDENCVYLLIRFAIFAMQQNHIIVAANRKFKGEIFKCCWLGHGLIIWQDQRETLWNFFRCLRLLDLSINRVNDKLYQ